MSNIRLKDIISLVSSEFNISKNEIHSLRQMAKITTARFAVYGLARIWTALSFPQIGRAIADRDHTTVLYGNRRFEEMMRSDPVFERRVRRIEIVLAYLSAMRSANARVAA